MLSEEKERGKALRELRKARRIAMKMIKDEQTPATQKIRWMNALGYLTMATNNILKSTQFDVASPPEDISPLLKKVPLKAFKVFQDRDVDEPHRFSKRVYFSSRGPQVISRRAIKHGRAETPE